MSDRDDFDWGRMRREEDDYLAAKRKPAKRLDDVLPAVIKRVEARGRLEGEDQARIDHLRSMPYDQYLRTEHWREIRNRTMERDGHQCRWCGSRKVLNVHHLTYERRGQERASDVITLCRSCQELAHPERMD